MKKEDLPGDDGMDFEYVAALAQLDLFAGKKLVTGANGFGGQDHCLKVCGAERRCAARSHWLTHPASAVRISISRSFGGAQPEPDTPKPRP
jgi:hypothetical protein